MKDGLAAAHFRWPEASLPQTRVCHTQKKSATCPSAAATS